VLPLGRFLGGDEAGTRTELATLVEAAHEHGIGLKVVIETGHLTDQLVERAARLVIDVGGDWVKTSTGFGPRGATAHDVQLIRGVVEGRAQVKAAGGIRTFDDAVALLDAGADALGTSAFASVLGADTASVET